MSTPPEEITVTVDGGTFPVIELLTGRGFITGKSGAGKSVTTSVIAEELLKHDLSFLVIDTDGEYYGLKEKFEVLHVGADDSCDAKVGIEHAEVLAEIALEDDVPIVLDVSGYLDEDEVDAMIERLVRELFVREKQLRKPFLLIVEEVHEYLPESSGLSDVGERLLQIAKRGRKRGLGMCGVSQRPAAVDKDFITQCNWIIWHRLTWNNDTDVVARIIDSEAAEIVEHLENGEALLMSDWDEEVRRVKFRMRETVDVGQTPDFSDPEIPELRSVDATYIERLESVSGWRSDGTSKNEPTTTETSSAATSSPAEDENTEDENTEDENAGEEETDTDNEQTAQSASENAVSSGRGSRSSPPGASAQQRDHILVELGDLSVYIFYLLRVKLRGLFQVLRITSRSATDPIAPSELESADRTRLKRLTRLLILGTAVAIGLSLLILFLS